MEEGDDFGPVAASVRRLGGRVTVSQVVMDSGLSVDDVEAELGALLRDAGGLFEIGGGAGAGDDAELSVGQGHLHDPRSPNGPAVRYVFPPGRGL